MSSSGTGPSIDHGAYSTLTEFILLKRNVKSSFSCCISFECPKSVFGFLTKESPLCHLIDSSSVLLATPEAKDGVEPSFQDLQSNTFPLCYLAKPATSCAKVKRLFFLPRSLFFYICGGGRSALYDRRRVTREEGTTEFSLALFNLPFLIESSKQLKK